jgi:hypothetical protein
MLKQEEQDVDTENRECFNREKGMLVKRKQNIGNFEPK